ncbi:hypothetical protein [Brevibacillus laterosporus]|uniref:hypothetical protein n=1 Tax=Brevibacillus laterosporus TaxID=1465 RepID=UPI003D1ED607
MKELSKKNAEKMLKEYSRGRIFMDYSRKEIFQLGMVEALNIAEIIVPGINDSDKEKE